MVAPVFEEVSDDELALAVHERADAQAFAHLYERHSPGVYDFVYRMLRDPDLAADVTQDTFAGAWTNLQKREVSGNVRAWLFTIARNRAINEIRRSRRFISHREGDSNDDPLLYTVDQSRLSDPEKLAIDEELAELVWTSASALKPREYSLLDLHIRRGLSPEEIADATGASRKNIHVNLFRLRKSMEQSVSGLLMMRRGRRECPQLNAILSGAGAENLTPRVKRLVSKHVDQCGRCQDLRRHFISPVEIFASLALIPLPEETRTVIWNGIVLAVAAGGAVAGAVAGVAWGPLGWLTGKATGVQGAAVAGGAVVAGVAITVTALLITSSGESPSPRDPGDVHSSSHQVGRLSENNVVELAWSRQPDVAGYSIEWSSAGERLPDQTADLPGDAVGVRSNPLPAGRWYFNLRTENESRRWTSTVHVGPFIIGPVFISAPDAPAPASSPATPAPTPTPAVAGVSATPAPAAPGAAARNAATRPPPGTSPATATPRPSPPVPTPVPALLTVEIDVMPDSSSNRIYLRRDEEVDVAIINTASFDVTTADRGSIRFANAQPTSAGLNDVDRDGDKDLLLEFQINATNITEGDVFACLSGRTLQGQPFQGCDDIKVTREADDEHDEASYHLGLGSFAFIAAAFLPPQPRRSSASSRAGSQEPV